MELDVEVETYSVYCKARVLKDNSQPTMNRVIGSRRKAHSVDALAVRGDERRNSLRKASGRRQISYDPEMSEWGNPPSIS